MAVGDSERYGELDHYDPEYPSDADERDLVEHDAAAEREELRRDIYRDNNYRRGYI